MKLRSSQPPSLLSLLIWIIRPSPDVAEATTDFIILSNPSEPQIWRERRGWTVSTLHLKWGFYDGAHHVGEA